MQRSFSLFLVVFLITLSAHAQKDTVYNAKQEIILDGKRFRVHNNFLNIGAGKGINSAIPFTQTNLNVDFHFHFNKYFFQLGTFLSGDRFLSFNTYNIHLCYGYRKETVNHNIFFSAGPSYSWGYPLINGNYNPNLYSVYGAYAEAQYVYKFAFDLGLGLSAFGDFNVRQTVYGLRGLIFFSGAYRGDRKKKPDWDN
jgi:hypothetical protein